MVLRYIQAASQEVARSRILEPTIKAVTIIVFAAFISPYGLLAQTKGAREIRVPYTLGGSAGYFWIAYRSGAFERHGLKIQPIYIRSGFAALQSLLAREVQIELQGGSAATAAWAKGAKDLVYVAACGNRLDYILIAHSSIHKAQDLKPRGRFGLPTPFGLAREKSGLSCAVGYFKTRFSIYHFGNSYDSFIHSCGA